MEPRTDEEWSRLRRALVDRLRTSENLSKRALDALLAVPRHVFVPQRHRVESYHNHPLPIGQGQTISQPFMVGWLVDALQVRTGMRVLEIGTGCGYQSAVLAAAGAEVWSVEIRPRLSARARATLDSLGLSGIQLRIGDGAEGWPEAAPFDGIVLTAAPLEVPDRLFGQLAPHGVLVAPVGPVREVQSLIRYRRSSPNTPPAPEHLGGCVFVPMIDLKGRQHHHQPR
jgi:protein-L-isoaspartate(D-aspartate) O-methyltransferase